MLVWTLPVYEPTLAFVMTTWTTTDTAPLADTDTGEVNVIFDSFVVTDGVSETVVPLTVMSLALTLAATVVES